jgi:hypothetical protein
MRIAAIILFGVAAVSALAIVRPPASLTISSGNTTVAFIHVERSFFILLSGTAAAAGVAMLRSRRRVATG